MMTVKMFAQKATYDLLTYTAPSDWTEEAAENTISYLGINKKTNAWCRIWIVKSTVSKGSIEADFENEWQELIVKSYTLTGQRKENETQQVEGWKIKSGSTKFIFNNNEAMAMLTTSSGYNRCLSVVAVLNNKNYLKDVQAFIASIDLIKPETTEPQTTVTNADTKSIVGTWGITASDQNSVRVNNGVSGTIFRQYTFNANGTYIFIVKTFDPLMDKILLGRETGTYQINGTAVSVIPKKSVLEAWSKKNNTDWGKLLSTQNIALEKTSYQFTKQFIADINEWQIVLQAERPTKRDGPFNMPGTNGWVYIVPSPARPEIKLPDGQSIQSEVSVQENAQKKETVQQTVTNNNASLVGSWGKSNSIGQLNNRFGTYSYNKQQYTFNSNGTYLFTGKNYSEQYDETLLIKENGTFLISGNNLTINPQNSVIEAWSKKNGGDNWNQLKTSQKRSIEKITYQFAVVEKNLVLQAAKETVRDGRFSNGNSYTYGPPGTFTAIKLPGE